MKKSSLRKIKMLSLNFLVGDGIPSGYGQRTPQELEKKLWREASKCRATSPVMKRDGWYMRRSSKNQEHVSWWEYNGTAWTSSDLADKFQSELSKFEQGPMLEMSVFEALETLRLMGRANAYTRQMLMNDMVARIRMSSFFCRVGSCGPSGVRRRRRKRSEERAVSVYSQAFRPRTVCLMDENWNGSGDLEETPAQVIAGC